MGAGARDDGGGWSEAGGPVLAGDEKGGAAEACGPTGAGDGDGGGAGANVERVGGGDCP